MTEPMEQKQPPNRIYLQWFDGDGEHDLYGDITWCSEMIADHDIVYQRITDETIADHNFALLRAEIVAILAECEAQAGWHGNGSDHGIYYCEVCGESHEDSDLIKHTPTCHVPQLRDLLAKIKECE